MVCKKHEGKLKPDGCSACIQDIWDNPQIGSIDCEGKYHPPRR